MVEFCLTCIASLKKKNSKVFKDLHSSLFKVGFAPPVVIYDSKRSFRGADLEQQRKSEGHHTGLWIFFFSCTLKSQSYHHRNLKLTWFPWTVLLFWIHEQHKQVSICGQNVSRFIAHNSRRCCFFIILSHQVHSENLCKAIFYSINQSHDSSSISVSKTEVEDNSNRQQYSVTDSV